MIFLTDNKWAEKTTSTIKKNCLQVLTENKRVQLVHSHRPVDAQSVLLQLMRLQGNCMYILTKKLVAEIAQTFSKLNVRQLNIRRQLTN